MTDGIPVDAVDFFAELELNNDRAWWAVNKQRWQEVVRDPLSRLVDALSDEFGEAKLFRPHRDVRFSADKSPFKTHQGAVVATSPGVGYYVQVSAGGLMTGAGWYAPTSAQVSSYREAVLAPVSGQALQGVVDALAAAGFELAGDALKTAPRGVDPAHERIELLRWRSLLVSREFGTPSWLETAEVLDRVRADWRSYRGLIEWFGDNL